MNQAIQQLDKATEQNASASEQVAATSETLTRQATQLQATISYFKVERTGSVVVDGNVAKLRAKAGAMRSAEVAKVAKQAAPARAKKVANGGFALALDESGDDLDGDFLKARV